MTRRDPFQAIADPIRRQIIVLLAAQSLNLNAIAAEFTISRPAISKHIKILKECGIIAVRQQGRERYCSIQAERLSEIDAWISQFRALWEARLDRFGAYLETLQSQENKDDNND